MWPKKTVLHWEVNPSLSIHKPELDNARNWNISVTPGYEKKGKSEFDARQRQRFNLLLLLLRHSSLNLYSKN
jgi:hypothetical protein